MHHPYVTATLSAQRHRDLVVAADRARLARSAAPPAGLTRRLLATWRAAWAGVAVPVPAPRMHDYPVRRS